MDRWDAIVVGGGLAGSSFALNLARSGKCVLLLERTISAHHKVCGEFISEECLSLLNLCGIDVENYGAAVPKNLRMIAGENEVSLPLPFKAAGLSRYRLDQLFLAKAEQAGVVVKRGVVVTEIGQTGLKNCVKIGQKTITAPIVGYATGKFNVRNFSLPHLKKPASNLVGFKMMASLTPRALEMLGDHVQLMSYSGGYQGMQMVEDDQASICWMVHSKDAKILGSDWHSHVDFLSRQSSITANILKETIPLWSKTIAISVPQMGFLRKNAIAPGVFPLGDQMAVIPSFTGDGMTVALASGILAARTILRGETATVYQNEFRKILVPQFHLARLAQAAILNPATRWAGIRMLEFIPGIAKYVANSTRLSSRFIESALS